MHRNLIMALAAGMALALAAPASAHTQHSTSRGQVVSYADLDLTTEQGSQSLLNRIRSAARNVCQVGFGPQPIEWRIASQRCMRDAMTTAVAQINAPVVTAMYEGREARTMLASR